MIYTNNSSLYIPDTGYFQQHNFVSNSSFNEMKGWYKLGRNIDLTAAYNFGNLLDGIMTEPELVNMRDMSVIVADGSSINFDMPTFNKAIRMRDHAYKDADVKLIMSNMDFQAEHYIDNFEVEYEGRIFYIPIRIKLDGENKRIKTNMDLKSTSCTTYNSFIESLYQFNYDQQGALYMDVSGCDRFWFIGVGKKELRNGTFPIFKFCFKRGDDFYLSGKKKYTFWADKYDQLVLNLNTSLI